MRVAPARESRKFARFGQLMLLKWLKKPRFLSPDIDLEPHYEYNRKDDTGKARSERTLGERISHPFSSVPIYSERGQ